MDERGHDVQLVMQPGTRSWPASVLTLARECPAIQLSTLPEAAFDHWWELASRFRYSRLYLRFLKPEYRGTPGLLARARARAPRPAVHLGQWLGTHIALRQMLGRAIDVLEQSTRSAAVLHQYLRDQRPDVVVMTPLVVLKTAQLDLARAAMELGVRNVFAVASWDHLSSKTELTFSPQRAFVWNEIQKKEVVQWHGMTADDVVVTGSQVFDEWFARTPSTTRADFCARIGLRADRPIVLYVCSSLLEGSAPEAPFVIRWAQHLRASKHALLRECGILVRPHFRRRREWRDVSLDGLASTACWPLEGDAPADAEAKADYFDSLYHADAIVGLNTSAMIEGAIVGRPVHTVLLPEFTESQEGTIHFHYLLNDTHGVLHATRSLDDHADDLAATLEGRGTDADRSARFVRTFVRPSGLEIPATARFVDELERLVALPPPVPVTVPPWTHLIRPVLWPFAVAASAKARRSRESFHRHKRELLIEHRRRKAADRSTSARRQP